MSTIQKPITLVREDFIHALTDLINTSKLPAFIIEPILRDAHSEVQVVAANQLESDRKRYNEAMKSQEVDGDE